MARDLPSLRLFPELCVCSDTRHFSLKHVCMWVYVCTHTHTHTDTHTHTHTQLAELHQVGSLQRRWTSLFVVTEDDQCSVCWHISFDGHCIVLKEEKQVIMKMEALLKCR